jgi:hypothetical protein
VCVCNCGSDTFDCQVSGKIDKEITQTIDVVVVLFYSYIVRPCLRTKLKSSMPLLNLDPCEYVHSKITVSRRQKVLKISWVKPQTVQKRRTKNQKNHGPVSPEGLSGGKGFESFITDDAGSIPGKDRLFFF